MVIPLRRLDHGHEFACCDARANVGGHGDDSAEGRSHVAAEACGIALLCGRGIGRNGMCHSPVFDAIDHRRRTSPRVACFLASSLDVISRISCLFGLMPTSHPESGR